MIKNVKINNFYGFDSNSFDLNKETKIDIKDGKSNFVKALFVLKAYALREEQNMKYIPFLLNEEDKTVLSITFHFNNTEYKYDLSLKNNSIVNEEIYIKNNEQWQLEAERIERHIHYVNSENNDQFKNFIMANNLSIVSIFNFFKVKKTPLFLTEINAFFKSIFIHLDHLINSDNFYYSNELLDSISSFYKEKEGERFLFDFINIENNKIKNIRIFNAYSHTRNSISFPFFSISKSFESKNEIKNEIPFSIMSSGTKNAFIFSKVFYNFCFIEDNSILVIDDMTKLFSKESNEYIKHKINKSSNQIIYT